MATKEQMLTQKYARAGFKIDFKRPNLRESVKDAKLGTFAVLSNDAITAEFSVRENFRGNRIISTFLHAEGISFREDWPSSDDDDMKLWDSLLSVSDNVELLNAFVE